MPEWQAYALTWAIITPLAIIALGLLLGHIRGRT